MGTPNLPEDIDRELRGPIQVNQALDVATRQGFWNFQPDRELTDQQNFDPYNVWYERNGGTVTKPGSGLYQLATDGSTDSEAILETADIGIYRPGGLANVSGGVWVDTLPEGDAEYRIGYDQDGVTEEIEFLIDSSDTLKFRFDSERYSGNGFQVPQAWMRAGEVNTLQDEGEDIAEVYGLARTDGQGLNLDRWDPRRGYLYGITLGWYGPTSVMPWIGEVGNVNGAWMQRAWPLAIVRPLGGPLVRQPNRPWAVTAQSNTSGQALQARVGGRQFSTSVDVQTNPEPTFDYAQNQDIPTSGQGQGNWSVLAVIRRKAGYDGTAIGVDRLDVVPNSTDCRVLVRLVDPSYLSGVVYDEPVDTPAEQTALELDLRSSTPDNVTIDEFTVDGSTKLRGIGWTGGFSNANFFATGNTQIGAGFSFPVVRNYPTVVLGATRTGSSATVDTSIEFLEVG